MAKGVDEPKSPEQIPQNPLLCTEFLPYVDTKPPTRPPFSPPNLLSLFLQSSTFLFIFCAIIYIFFLPFLGVSIILSKHSKPFYCIISLSLHKTCFTHIFVQRQALRDLYRSTPHNATKQPCRYTTLRRLYYPNNNVGITDSGRPPLPLS